jgi:hypothetical protein
MLQCPVIIFTSLLFLELQRSDAVIHTVLRMKSIAGLFNVRVLIEMVWSIP